MKQKFIVSALLCMLIVCLYLFKVIYSEAKQRAILELNSRQMIHAKQAKGGIEAYFSDIIKFLTKLSESDHIADFDTQGQNELDFALQIKPEGIKAITRVDASGKITYTTPFNRSVIGRDISIQKHVRTILKTHRPVVSDVFKAVQGYSAIALHVPVFKGNEFRGTLAVLIDFLTISKRFIQDIRVGETGYAWITSSEGIELFSPIPGHIGNSVFKNHKEFPSALAMATEMVKGKQGITTYTSNRIKNQKLEKTEKHAVYLPIRIVDSFWTVVVATSEIEVLATLVSLKNKVILVVGLLLFCITIFSYYCTKALGIIKAAAERKKIEEALRESEERYRFIAENVADVLWTMDMDLNFTFISSSIHQQRGYTVSEAMALTLEDALLPDSLEKVMALFTKKLSLIEDGDKKGFASVVFEIEQPCKDGSVIWTNNNVRILPGPDKQAESILGITRDITQSKLTEKTLRASHERFLTVLDSIDATVYVADLESYEILFMNKNMVESFGRDMTGEICWSVFREESEPCRECTNKQLIDENGKPAGVCTWHGKNPVTNKWYINHDRAIEWVDGRLVRLQIATDITDLKLMEQQVQQSQKFKAIGTLAGGIAHDFNNLLMGIQGRASLLSVDLKSHPGVEHINAIEDYIRSATDLTKQLLGLARGGKYEVKTTDLNELVRTSANMFGRTKKEIRIHLKMEKTPLAVDVDKGQIEQALLNLYVNAWQAMPVGGELYITTQIVTLDNYYIEAYNAKPGRYTKASITDTGIGMDENIQQQIFDPFFTTKAKGRGTGLGLASAYGIIKNHGGIITVHSKVGRGTTFDIYLPLSNKTIRQETFDSEELIKGTEKLLLVDDEAMILEVGQALLEKLGYQVLTADSGHKALEIIRNKGDKIDLVVLDLIMPGMEGGQVFDHVREILPQIPVMLSSGYAISGQANKIMKRGCNGFIQKPFNISTLSKKVREILDAAENSKQSYRH